MALGCPTSAALDYEIKLYGRSSPKEELSIEIGDINSVHINDMNLLETGEREIFEDFTTQAACTYDQNLVGVEIISCLAPSAHEGDLLSTSVPSKDGSVKGPDLLKIRSMVLHLDFQSV